MADFNIHIDESSAETVINSYYKLNPFTNDLGIKFALNEKKEIIVTMLIEKEHSNFYSISHGGVLMSFCDAAMGAVCLNTKKKVVTLDFNINLIRAVNIGDIIEAKPIIIHNGGHTLVVECSVYSKNTGKLVCTSRATMYVVGKIDA